MNAPDKIYIEQKAVMYDMVNTEPCKPDDYEYIRKGALLEWAKETYLNENASAIRKVCYKQLVDKIESL